MMENKTLFGKLGDHHGNYDPHKHIAEMIAVLGPPPLTLVEHERACREQMSFEHPIHNEQGRVCNTVSEYWGGPFFDDKGEFVHSGLIPDRPNLEDSVTMVDGLEKELFLDLLRHMLDWHKERRLTAGQLLRHPFIASLKDDEVGVID